MTSLHLQFDRRTAVDGMRSVGRPMRMAVSRRRTLSWRWVGMRVAEAQQREWPRGPLPSHLHITDNNTTACTSPSAHGGAFARADSPCPICFQRSRIGAEVSGAGVGCKQPSAIHVACDGCGFDHYAIRTPLSLLLLDENRRENSKSVGIEVETIPIHRCYAILLRAVKKLACVEFCPISFFSATFICCSPPRSGPALREEFPPQWLDAQPWKRT